MLLRSRRHWAVMLVRAAANAKSRQAAELLKYLPQYGDFWASRLLSLLLRAGGAGLIRTYTALKLSGRQVIKRFFYKSPDKALCQTGQPHHNR